MSTLGDIATIAAPTVVAVAAIGTSTWQQSRSRAFDRAEREKEREHDQAMREAAERHERKLSDIEYQRRLVDDVIDAMEAANDAVGTLSANWDLHPVEEDEEDNDRWQMMISGVGDAGDRLKVVNARMILRFGRQHEAVRTIALAASAASRAWWAVIANEHGQYGERQVSMSLNAAQRDVRDAVESFLTITGGIVGSAPERD